MTNATGLPGRAETWVLDGITFNGAPDANGVEYVMDVLGWSSSAAPRASHTARPGSPGTFKNPSPKDGKPLGCSGWVYAPTTLLRRNAEHRIAALLNDATAEYKMTCTEETGDLFANVELDDKIEVLLGNDERYLDFTFQLWQSDPRRYGAPFGDLTMLASSSGGLDWTGGGTGGLDWSTGGGLDWGVAASDGVAQVFNAGTAPSWPVFTVRGPTVSGTLSNISITNGLTGQRLFYGGSLAVGDVLTINTSPYARKVLLNGIADRRALMGAVPWFPILPGVSTPITFQGTSGTTTASLTVSGFDGYW